MKITEALWGVTQIGIDSAPLIYLVEKHPAHIEKMMIVIEYINQGIMLGISATLTLTEVLTLPTKLDKASLIAEYEDILLNSSGFQLLPLDAEIAKTAANLRARYALRTPDAVQIGTAISAGCQVFLTNDLGLKRVKDVRVLVLDELEVALSDREKD